MRFAGGLALVLLLVVCSVKSATYCATWSDPSIATGFFVAELNETATYTFDLNFTLTPALLAKCPGLNATPTGFKFHFHSLWTWGDQNASAELDSCGPTHLSGHYDPNFACASVSSWAGTSCVSLNRTAAQGYTYSCSPTAFAARPGACEIGDLSGKFGQASVTNLETELLRVKPPSQYMTDVLPPYAADFYLDNGLSLSGWSSVLFHCGDATANRLLCAQLRQVSSWTECAPSSVPPPAALPHTCSNPSPAASTGFSAIFDNKDNLPYTVGSVAAAFVIGLLGGSLLMRCCSGSKKRTADHYMSLGGS